MLLIWHTLSDNLGFGLELLNELAHGLHLLEQRCCPRAALERERSSAWALLGLKAAAEAKGDSAEARKADEALSKAWRGDKAMLTLGRL